MIAQEGTTVLAGQNWPADRDRHCRGGAFRPAAAPSATSLRASEADLTASLALNIERMIKVRNPDLEG